MRPSKLRVRLNQVQRQRVMPGRAPAVSAPPRKPTSPPRPYRGLRRGRGEDPSPRFVLSRCLLSPVLCPVEMQKGLTWPFQMRAPIPRAAWRRLQPCSSQRAWLTGRAFEGWLSRQLVGFNLALPRSSPTMRFLQVRTNQEACSSAAACHDLGWGGCRDRRVCRGGPGTLVPIRDPSNSPVVDGGRVSVARPGIQPAPASFNLWGCEDISGHLINPLHLARA